MYTNRQTGGGRYGPADARLVCVGRASEACVWSLPTYVLCFQCPPYFMFSINKQNKAQFTQNNFRTRSTENQKCRSLNPFLSQVATGNRATDTAKKKRRVKFCDHKVFSVCLVSAFNNLDNGTETRIFVRFEHYVELPVAEIVLSWWIAASIRVIT